MIGKIFGKWAVIKEIVDHSEHDKVYECICECGRVNNIRRYSLRSGRSLACKSCSHKTHGMTETSTYIIWESMKKRCANPNNSHYKYYGGRGIKVCDSWNKFEVFLKDMGKRPEGLELDRIDVNGNYEPSNCRWVTKSINQLNKRKPICITGERFGKWLVKEISSERINNKICYNCICDCGKVQVVMKIQLVNGRSTQCITCRNKNNANT
jgi:hypothetical protein